MISVCLVAFIRLQANVMQSCGFTSGLLTRSMSVSHRDRQYEVRSEPAEGYEQPHKILDCFGRKSVMAEVPAGRLPNGLAEVRDIVDLARKFRRLCADQIPDRGPQAGASTRFQ